MTVTLEGWSWAMIAVSLTAIWLSGFLAGRPDHNPPAAGPGTEQWIPRRIPVQRVAFVEREAERIAAVRWRDTAGEDEASG